MPKEKGYEKGESQAFWMSLLRDVYGVTHPEQFISFEDQVKLDHTSFIDGYIEATHVMIEQKGLGKDLRKGIKQSDGSVLEICENVGFDNLSYFIRSFKAKYGVTPGKYAIITKSMQ